MTTILRTAPIATSRAMIGAAVALGGLGLAAAAPAVAQYRQEIRNDMSLCASDAGPAVLVTLDGVKSSKGKIRVQSYRATESEWMEKGRWLARLEAPARAGRMTFCIPVPAPGNYGIAIRHDINGNGSTDIMSDGGGMSNNPSINIFNLGKPSYRKTSFPVGSGVKAISIQMRYM